MMSKQIIRTKNKEQRTKMYIDDYFEKKTKINNLSLKNQRRKIFTLYGYMGYGI